MVSQGAFANLAAGSLYQTALKECECGCKTLINAFGSKRRPVRFVFGHQNIIDPMSLINKSIDGCWNWLGRRDVNGYGKFGNIWAHRKIYEISVGKIPNGLQLDHLCRNRICVNPKHLEPVTRIENILRSSIIKFTDDEIKQMRSLRKQGFEVKQIAEKFAMDRGYASRVTRWINRVTESESNCQLDRFIDADIEDSEHAE